MKVVETAREIAKETASEFSKDNVLTLSAALAYYAIFSIGPVLAIFVALAGAAFGFDTVRTHIHSALQGMLGEGSAKTVDSMMSMRQQGSSVLLKTIGTASLLFGATGVFGQLQTSLNTIWGVKSKPGRGLMLLVRNRFLSFSMVLGVGFLLLISLALSTALAAFTGVVGAAVAQSGAVSHALEIGVSFVVITVLFAVMYKYLPDVKVPWRCVWVGAIGSSLLFALGKNLLALYLGRESTASTYGAAGSVIVVLMWVYYASLILFLGAELTQIYARHTGIKVVPSDYAVSFEKVEVEHHA